MAGFSKGQNNDIISDINVTPLVDVMLVLLVIFMMAAPLLYKSGLQVELPKAVSGENAERVTLRFVLAKDGSLNFGNEPSSLAKVPEITSLALKKDPTASAIVSADKDCSHGQVIGLIDSLKQSGIAKIALGVETAQAKGSK